MVVDEEAADHLFLGYDDWGGNIFCLENEKWVKNGFLVNFSSLCNFFFHVSDQYLALVPLCLFNKEL